MVDIPSTPADGNIRTVIVTTPPADPFAPTAVALNGGEDISCYLTPGGFALTVDQATVTDERECSTQSYGAPGRKTYSLAITGIDNTNSANEDDYNVLVDALPEGATRYAYRRRGLAYDAPFATGQKVWVIPFTVGVKSEVASEANSVTRSTWSTFPSGEVREVTVA